MDNDDVLGYAPTPDGGYEPIHNAKHGYVYTQAFILCSRCRTAIRPQGGPMLGAICKECYERTN